MTKNYLKDYFSILDYIYFSSYYGYFMFVFFLGANKLVMVFLNILVFDEYLFRALVLAPMWNCYSA